jgi:hypothetical protein
MVALSISWGQSGQPAIPFCGQNSLRVLFQKFSKKTQKNQKKPKKTRKNAKKREKTRKFTNIYDFLRLSLLSPITHP